MNTNRLSPSRGALVLSVSSLDHVRELINDILVETELAYDPGSEQFRLNRRPAASRIKSLRVLLEAKAGAIETHRDLDSATAPASPVEENANFDEWAELFRRSMAEDYHLLEQDLGWDVQFAGASKR